MTSCLKNLISTTTNIITTFEMSIPYRIDVTSVDFVAMYFRTLKGHILIANDRLMVKNVKESLVDVC